MDIRPPAGVSANSVFCAAGQCGAPFGLNEGAGGQHSKIRKVITIIFSSFLHITSPKAPNAIPPNCTPGSKCSNLK
jgi:hypothetical protein